jgi:mannose-6-phosphate isomerase
MPKLDRPLLLAPVFKAKIWGRDDLSPWFESPPASSGVAEGERIGEVWLTGDDAVFRSGPVAGLTLGEASQKWGAELHGSEWKGDRFPILSKYIFTTDWLSVQVHPDDEFARRHNEPDGTGKTEMWYFLAVEPGARYLLGTKPGVSREAFKQAVEAGRSRETLQEISPTHGEAVYLRPGAVHALGPGVVLFEVEQNSDVTYRLDDFGRLGTDGRPRELHLAKAFEVAREVGTPYEPLPWLEASEPWGSRRFVVACPHFAVETLNLRRLAKFESSPERVEILAMLDGHGRIETAEGWWGYDEGETWIIPPGLGSYRIAPVEKTDLLKYYVPDLERDFRAPLRELGARPDEIERVVFE